MLQFGVARCTWTSELLTHHLDNDAGWLKYGIGSAELSLWAGCLLALCYLTECGSYSLCFPETRGRSLCHRTMLSCKLATTNLSVTKTSSLGSLPLSLGGRTFLGHMCRVTPFCALRRRRKRKMGKTLRMEEVTIYPNSMFTRHGYLRHAKGSLW